MFCVVFAWFLYSTTQFYETAFSLIFKKLDF